ncbi:MAG: endonuclease V [Candidatus Bathyarchaeia archaeon]
MDNANLTFSVEKAHKTQLCLAKKLIFEDRLPSKIRYVAGVDVAYSGKWSIGAAVLLDYDSLKLLETQTAICETRFPYIPTLLSFRETPPAVLSIKKLQTQPDVLLVDGHGFAHPHHCGFASHLGLVLNKPTIGVAKSILCGQKEEKDFEETVSFLKHEGKIVGAAVKTKSGRKPVYVSVGHMVSLKTAIKIVQHCTLNSRVPKPILIAHETATLEKRKINMASAIKK